MIVTLPSPLIEYTNGRREVAAVGRTLNELLGDLDRQYPGIRFRMIDEQRRVRPHIKLFVDAELQCDLDAPVGHATELLIVAALSGG